MRNGILVLTVLLVWGGLCLAECPSADVNGDCLVNFLDFQMMGPESRFFELQTMASQWLDADFEPLTILGRVDMQADGPDSFAVELVVVDKQRVDRSVFEYECEVILRNTSAEPVENVQLGMVGCPDNMTIIDPHVSFGDAQIGPSQTAASLDTCVFTVDRSDPINPVEIVWHHITTLGDMVLIPGGTFEMGDHFDEGYGEELPVHTVTVDSFYMGKYETTNEQYCDYLNSAMSQGLITVTSGVVYKAGSGTSYPYCDTHSANPHTQIDYSDGVFSVRTKGSTTEMANHPIVEVSWFGSVAYCNWRSQEDGYEDCYDLSTWDCNFANNGYRLPTEAEWEYAARGGLAGKRYPWGDSIVTSQANYSDSGDPYEAGGYPWTTSVGFYDGQLRQKADFNWPGSQSSYQTSSGVNGYGLYDMTGNLWEWCNDWSDQPDYDYYQNSPDENPKGPASGAARVLRGGAWLHGTAHDCRVARRGHHPPPNRRIFIGFRIVLPFQECEAPDVEVVDDMELYTHWCVPDNNIFEIWEDGVGDCTFGSGNATGSTVNEGLAPFLSGLQSMRYDYDNDGSVFNPCTLRIEPRAYLYSKVEAQIAALPSGIGSNWNPCGTTLLVLNFHGMPGNAVEEVDPLWVELKDAAGNSGKVVYGARQGENPQHLAEDSWHEWVIDMHDFAGEGVDATDVASMAIGVGEEGSTTPGGSGTLYFDDIILTTSRQAP